jgi:hypothetical protein
LQTLDKVFRNPIGQYELILGFSEDNIGLVHKKGSDKKYLWYLCRCPFDSTVVSEDDPCFEIHEEETHPRNGFQRL